MTEGGCKKSGPPEVLQPNGVEKPTLDPEAAMAWMMMDKVLSQRGIWLHADPACRDWNGLGHGGIVIGRLDRILSISRKEISE